MNLSLAPFDRGERVVETERILELLIESRFGPGRPYLHFEARYVTESMADTVIYDLMPSGPFPFIAEAQCADSISERDCKVRTGKRLNFPATPVGAPALRYPPTTLARGSPTHWRL